MFGALEINIAVNKKDKRPCSHGIYSAIGERQMYIIFTYLYIYYKSNVEKCCKVGKQVKGLESDSGRVIFYARLSKKASQRDGV